MSEQIDIAVDLGVVPPPQIIEGLLHQGCKMVLGGASKSNKSWCLLDLSLSVASGSDWWGRPCSKANVLYLTFELHPRAIAERLNAIAGRPKPSEKDAFFARPLKWARMGFAQGFQNLEDTHSGQNRWRRTARLLGFVSYMTEL